MSSNVTPYVRCKCGHELSGFKILDRRGRFEPGTDNEKPALTSNDRGRWFQNGPIWQVSDFMICGTPSQASVQAPVSACPSLASCSGIRIPEPRNDVKAGAIIPCP